MTPYAITLYALALITSMGCLVLLLREYLRLRIRLLLWSALCFVGLTVNNAILFVDLVIYPDTDLRLYRLLASLAGVLFLLYGFIWEAES